MCHILFLLNTSLWLFTIHMSALLLEEFNSKIVIVLVGDLLNEKTSTKRDFMTVSLKKPDEINSL